EGRATIGFTTRRLHRDEVRTSDDGRGVRIGSSHAERASDDSIHLSLRGAADRGRTIAAEFSFRPIVRVNREITLHESPGGGLHRWVIVDALCDVQGEVSIFDGGAGAPPHVIPFAGRGRHDHRYGTRPPREAGEWFGGRVLLSNRAIAFER